MHLPNNRKLLDIYKKSFEILSFFVECNLINPSLKINKQELACYCLGNDNRKIDCETGSFEYF